MTMDRVEAGQLLQRTVAWDVPVRLVPLRSGLDAGGRRTVLADPGHELPGVSAVAVTTVTVGGDVLLERLAPVADGPATVGLAELLAELQHGDVAPGADRAQVRAPEPGPVRVAVEGTPFTRAVLEALTRVPVGARCTYAELAAAAGRPRAVRAAASVMARNRVPLVLPCHRVVPTGGGTGRYGWGEDVKVALLAAEETRG
jgi:O-6-methylguanine DNA methyltransferase